MGTKHNRRLPNPLRRAGSVDKLKLNDLLLTACRRAASRVLSYYSPYAFSRRSVHRGPLSATDKDPNDPRTVVTAADLASEETILSILESNLHCSALSEEAGQTLAENDCEFRTIVDSLDGSKNFVQGSLGLFGISVGVERRGRPVAGAIALPWFNEVVSAEIGKGVFLNPLHPRSNVPSTKLRRLATSGLTLARARVCVARGAASADVLGEPPLRTIMTNANEALNYASCSVGISSVVLRRADALVLPCQRYWDFAAGLVIVRELGGQFGIWRENWAKLVNDSDLSKATSDSYFDIVATLDPVLFGEIKSFIDRR